MPRLFYKDMQQHETAYRHQRADEATNDLMLGAKVSAYTGFEQAKEKSIDEIATNYGKFLKALQTKEIPLAGKNLKVEKAVNTIVDESMETMRHENTLMPSSQQKTVLSTEPTQASIRGDYPVDVKSIIDAHNAVRNVSRYTSAFKGVRQALGPANSPLNAELTDILHDMGYTATTGKRRKGATRRTLNIGAIEESVKRLYNKHAIQT